jgi:hypothetical protein
MTPKDDDIIDLPVTTSNRLPTPADGPAAVIQTESVGVKLNEEQVGELVHAGAKVAGDLTEIGKGIVQIVRIREQSRAKVNEIEAQTRQVVAMMDRQIEAMKVQHEDLVTRGEISIALVQSLTRTLATIPVDDAATRQAAVAMIPELAEKTFANRDKS